MIAFAIAVSISHTSSSSFYCPLFVSKELVYEHASQGDISLLSAKNHHNQGLVEKLF